MAKVEAVSNRGTANTGTANTGTANTGTTNAGTSQAVDPSDIPPIVDESLTAAPALVAKLRSGTLTVEGAWKSGQLKKDDILAILGADVGGVWGEAGTLVGDLGSQLAGLLIEHYPDLVKDPTALRPSVRLWLGEYYRLHVDPHAVGIFEQLIVEGKPHVSKDGTRTGPAYYYEHATRSLGEYYTAMGEYEKAIEAFQEVVPNSQNSVYRASAMLSTARAYRQLGDEKKAQEFYARVTQYKDPWSSGVAVFDQASDLIKQGYYDQARKILEQGLQNPGSDVIRVPLLSTLGLSYYRAEEFPTAKKYFSQAISQYESLNTAGDKSGAMDQANVAYTGLEWINQWTKQPREPLVCEPREIRVKIGPGEKAQTPSPNHFFVRSFCAVPLTVTSDDPRIKAHVEDRQRTRDEDEFIPLYYQKEVVLEIAPGALAKSFDVTLLVSSTEYPGFQVRAPLHVEVD